MAGQLIQVATSTVTTPVASVDLVGINDDSVYMVTVTNAKHETTDDYLYQRVLVSSSPDISANYDLAGKQLCADVVFINQANTNQTQVQAYIGMGQDNGEKANFISYLYNFYNASQFSSATIEQSSMDSSSRFRSIQGSWVHTVAQSCNGIQFYAGGSRNLDSGTFTLYKVV